MRAGGRPPPYCEVAFAEGKDRVTIAPNGLGETLAGTGITIRVYLKDCNGVPLIGFPAEAVLLGNTRLCICPGGNIADGPTDANGMTTFSGTIRGGGCVEHLSIAADGVTIGTIPVKTNSPDHLPSTPCVVDVSDFSALATHLGIPGTYSPCFDYNESGVVDVSDLVYWATFVGAGCQTP